MKKTSFVILHALSGLYAGACLSIAYVDMRFMTAYDPAEVTHILAPMLISMGHLMAPQLVIMLCLTIFFSVKAIKMHKPFTAHLPTLLLLTIIAITAIVHIPINQALVAGTLPPAEVSSAIANWSWWHWVRTLLSFGLHLLLIKFFRPLIKR